MLRDFVEYGIGPAFCILVAMIGVGGVMVGFGFLMMALEVLL